MIYFLSTKCVLRLGVVSSVLIGVSGCVRYVDAPPHRAERAQQVVRPVSPVAVYQEPFEEQASQSGVVRVDEEPPLAQPEPVACPWAPPPLLVEVIPQPPDPEAVWVGGYWVWHGNWIWARGHWSFPPRPGYHWVHPYYEHRDGIVLFIAGYWGPWGMAFTPPPEGRRYPLEHLAAGVKPGPRPIGPNGVFIPAPPGSRPGLIVPAPIGISPAVLMYAPPVVNVGMHVHADVDNRVSVVNQITNITNVTVIAPPGVTTNGSAFNASIPVHGHSWTSPATSVPVRGPTVPSPSVVPVPSEPPREIDRKRDEPLAHQREEHAQPVAQPVVIRIIGEHEAHPVHPEVHRVDATRPVTPAVIEPVREMPPEHRAVPMVPIGVVSTPARREDQPGFVKAVRPEVAPLATGAKETHAETKRKEDDGSHRREHSADRDSKHEQ